MNKGRGRSHGERQCVCFPFGDKSVQVLDSLYRKHKGYDAEQDGSKIR